MEMSRLRLLMLGLAIALATAIITLVVAGRRAPELVLSVEPVAADAQITVYVGGAVARPGLYTLPAHARVADALDQARALDGADLARLPMAAVLHDGQQVIVPERAFGTPAATSAAIRATPVPQGPINVNTASAAELAALPGVGPVLAQRIVDYREAHGPFASLDDLDAVQGVSARMVADWREIATVGP
ncbi:MAG TPA: ComEA family DNA-binding protein [Thermomicrobiaceae bacterium]|nr:ComEA family DNA-binding protein [Thermomicrobiaceae bacterium]